MAYVRYFEGASSLGRHRLLPRVPTPYESNPLLHGVQCRPLLPLRNTPRLWSSRPPLLA